MGVCLSVCGCVGIDVFLFRGGQGRCVGLVVVAGLLRWGDVCGLRVQGSGDPNLVP